MMASSPSWHLRHRCEQSRPRSAGTPRPGLKRWACPSACSCSDRSGPPAPRASAATGRSPCASPSPRPAAPASHWPIPSLQAWPRRIWRSRACRGGYGWPWPRGSAPRPMPRSPPVRTARLPWPAQARPAVRPGRPGAAPAPRASPGPRAAAAWHGAPPRGPWPRCPRRSGPARSAAARCPARGRSGPPGGRPHGARTRGPRAPAVHAGLATPARCPGALSQRNPRSCRRRCRPGAVLQRGSRSLLSGAPAPRCSCWPG
mmetsp:Transcript_32056/g.88306  ORF Transcript_32056/g.88306 Transcript_32056/m.88306 type:complete len:259 (-) Transcript_32056:371-1147(-)